MKKVSIIVLCAVVMGAFEPGIMAAAPQKSSMSDRLKNEYGQFKTALRCFRKDGWKTCTPAQKKRIIATGVVLTALVVAIVAGSGFAGWRVIQKRKATKREEEKRQEEAKRREEVERKREQLTFEERAALDKELINAPEEGSLEEVQKLIDDGADVDASDWKGDTPLGEAVWLDELEMVTHLIACGANVNATDGDGWTPLHKAVLRNNPEILKLLLEKGATVFQKDINEARNRQLMGVSEDISELLEKKMKEQEAGPK